MYSRLLKLNGRLELFNELIKDHDSEEEEEMEMVNSEESSEVFESEASDNWFVLSIYIISVVCNISRWLEIGGQNRLELNTAESHGANCYAWMTENEQ